MTQTQQLPWGWVGFFSIIILLALVTGYTLISAGKQLAQHQIPEQSVLRILLDGTTYHVSKHTQAELVSEASQLIQTQQAQVIQKTRQNIEHLLNEAFAPVHDNIPLYADWHYSFSAEYLRFAHAFSGDIAKYLQDQLIQRVFQPAQLEQAIDALPSQLNSSLEQLLDTSREQISLQLKSIVSTHSNPNKTEVIEYSSQLDLDSLLNTRAELNEQFVNRQLLSTLAATGIGVSVGKGLGALMIKNSLAKIAASKSFQITASLLTKFAVKSTLKSGGTLGAAASGMIICSPGGPIALLCGVTAGIVTWVAVDTAVINLDEFFNREEYEADMHIAVSEQQQILLDIYTQVYTSILSNHFSKLHETGMQLLGPPPEFIPMETITR